VQRLLDEKRLASERPQVHRHYLKGSVFCDGCGQRLSFGVSTGRNGHKYAYFFL
jgi:site-specific DNA recombinase